ncbi:MAG: hypothetical protein FWE21_00930 [Defluviitaleaceae bacterium]|nr:hypothetical protein [Defluviitaleaceae bacterium]
MKQFTNENVNIHRPTAITIGKFDGLHRGHVTLIEEMKKMATLQGLATAILTFSPHPMAFFTKTHMPLILDPHEKAELFGQLGIDYYIQYKFDENFAHTTPRDFIEKILCTQLNAKMLVVSSDYRFGKGGAGDVDFARKAGKDMGLEVHVIQNLLNQQQQKISSNLLRGLIMDKEFKLVAQLCGRPFFISGKTDENGIITPHPDKILPPDGVYEVDIHGHGNTVIKIGGGVVKSDIKQSQALKIHFMV